MLNVVLPLPGLLEDADAFVQSQRIASDEEMLVYEELVQKIDRVFSAVYSIRHLPENGKPRMVQMNDHNAFNIEIEEHAFLISNTTFSEQYNFVSAHRAFAFSQCHQFSLITGCALLQVLYSAFAEKGTVPGGTKISMVDVEQAAYWHASEMCRSVYFYSQRSLTAARYLRSLLQCAANFFECYGAVNELSWCRGCLRATEMRIARMQATPSSSLCRLVDVVDGLSAGCKYGPRWKGVVEEI